MIRLSLNPELESEIAATANLRGQTPQEYIMVAVQKTLAAEPIATGGLELQYADLPPDQWIAKFDAWMQSIPRRSGPPLSDWSLSRDNM